MLYFVCDDGILLVHGLLVLCWFYLQVGFGLLVDLL